MAAVHLAESNDRYQKNDSEFIAGHLINRFVAVQSRSVIMPTALVFIIFYGDSRSPAQPSPRGSFKDTRAILFIP
jgi:hypothetical protein